MLCSLTARIVAPKQLDVKFENVTLGSQATEYTGSYEVTPKAVGDQVLPTQDTVLTRDITVFEIPTFETSNESGTTFYIANEV